MNSDTAVFSAIKIMRKPELETAGELCFEFNSWDGHRSLVICPNSYSNTHDLILDLIEAIVDGSIDGHWDRSDVKSVFNSLKKKLISLDEYTKG